MAATPDEERAANLFRLLTHGDTTLYQQWASPTMAKALKPDQLRAVFEDLARQAGAFRDVGEPRSEMREGYRMIEVPLEYQHAVQTGRVVFDAQGKIAGLQVRPRSGGLPFQSADYADATRYQEQAVVVDAGGWPLPATLTIPTGAGPFPALVLVHGSGPNDRDESIGPNKMFRDMAEGLGSRGIVVLRYEKRSREYAAKISHMETLTPQEEVIDDVLAGIRLLREQALVRKDGVFVAGHSFGGTMIPAIAKADASLAGVIILAGAIRPMEDTIVSQTRYLAQLDGQVSAAEAAQIREVEEFARQVRALKAPTDPPPTTAGMSAPTSYWLALRELDPRKLSPALQMPTLVLQGERDYQVTMEDFASWKALLANQPRATFKNFPGLNHAFMPGQGPSSPAEYSVPGHVDRAVIETLSDWIFSIY